jgi:lysophospholipase L1-like esterase
VACITILPYFVGLSSNHAGEEEKTELFRQILRDAVAACPHPNVHLIEGSEILDSTDCLSADMIHPSDYGMQRMGENLARRLKGVLA